ncbi:magnesium protoporphyrin IX methyltransferase, chloroplastic [Phoenix dactylifera]|uniref:Magnesium protoporphyrin IX methyltransferase, chloroplastic n=1 Tax=Phoenix dactylifera TaxID=42345 RepID=A0A8B7BHT2_PHODC|nr:magnesium protoporphyrin IX methyltransferase, chloroplastic [Phoenix dactylifera]
MAFAAVLSSASPNASPHLHLHPLSSKPPRSPTTRTLALPSAADLSLDAPAALAVGSVAALAAAISLADPERRRRQQAEEVGGDDKEVVRDYFNNTGFQRWKKIYGDSTEGVNRVQLDIRLGHAQTVESTLRMLRDGGALAGVTVCDAGCGTGSLAIPLAREGAVVSASDISATMVAEAQRQAEEALGNDANNPFVKMPKFEARDLESLEGKYDTVVCLDVLIHYPQGKAEGMIGHLASLAERRLVLSFAPKTFYYDLLKRVGELFPGPSKATRAYLHAERDIERALEKVGWRVRRRGLITTQFYFAKLIEAVPVGLA